MALNQGDSGDRRQRRHHPDAAAGRADPGVEDQRDPRLPRVMVEARDTSVDAQALKTDLERRMKKVLGVRVTVEMHGSGALDSYTGT